MKSASIKVIIGLVFLVLFNVGFFLLGGKEHSTVVWASYAFIHVAYLCLLATPLLCNAGRGLTVLAASLWLRAILFFLVELVVGVTVIVLDPAKTLWPILIQACLLGAFLIMQLMSVLANDSTNESIRKQQAENRFIQTLSEKVRLRISEINDEEARRQVERSLNALRGSSLESFPEAGEAESALRSAVDALCMAIEDGDGAEQITKKAKRVFTAVQERNSIINQCRM